MNQGGGAKKGEHRGVEHEGAEHRGIVCGGMDFVGQSTEREQRPRQALWKKSLTHSLALLPLHKGLGQEIKGCTELPGVTFLGMRQSWTQGKTKGNRSLEGSETM